MMAMRKGFRKLKKLSQEFLSSGGHTTTILLLRRRTTVTRFDILTFLYQVPDEIKRGSNLHITTFSIKDSNISCCYK